MEVQNYGDCNSCHKRVPARTVMREEQVYLVKCCEDCGDTQTLISSDAAQYFRKRSLDRPHDYRGCSFECLSCKHPKRPQTIFLDITNRCNLNCPICIANVSAMGFRYEPPMEYFEKIFSHFGQMNPRPSVQLFGGEPTVREDLVDIINLAWSYDVRPRVVTNGLRLADEEYCRKLLSTGVRILFSYDGAELETYRRLRNKSKALPLKLKALENIRKYAKTKITIMYVVAEGMNENELDTLFQFLHDRRDFISAVDFIPIAPTWVPGRFADLESKRITIEDVEGFVDRAFPNEPMEFLPAGVLDVDFFTEYFRLRRTPFAGVHPNCESVGLLVSNGKEYVPFSNYFKKSLFDVARHVRQTEETIVRRLGPITTGWLGTTLEKLGLQRAMSNVVVFVHVGNVLFRGVRLDRVLGARGFPAVAKALKIVTMIGVGHKTKDVMRAHSQLHTVLRVIVLPFEDDANRESARLERCAAAFAYVDPELDKVQTIPVCAWGLHKNRILAKVTEHYGLQTKGAHEELTQS